MNRAKTCLLLVAALGLPTVASLAADSAASAVGECVVEMEIPRYTALARLAVNTGTVDARVTIGERGRAGEVHIDSPDERLSQEVKVFVSAAKYSSKCRGRTVRLQFTYRLEGDPVPYPFVKIRFRPPNRFIIISQPQIPHVYLEPKATDKPIAK